MWRELGFERAATSRAVNRILDDCKIDIAINGTSFDMPVLQQCKSGYVKNRIKPDEEMLKIRTALSENFDENHSIHNTPIAVIHKLPRSVTLVTIDLNFYKELLKAWIMKK